MLLGLLTLDFLKLVLVGCLIAWPIAWWTFGRWLETFAYHTSLDPLLFLAGGLLVLLVAALTVGSQAWRAARTDPAVTLRYE